MFYDTNQIQIKNIVIIKCNGNQSDVLWVHRFLKTKTILQCTCFPFFIELLNHGINKPQTSSPLELQNQAIVVRAVKLQLLQMNAKQHSTPSNTLLEPRTSTKGRNCKCAAHFPDSFFFQNTQSPPYDTFSYFIGVFLRPSFEGESRSGRSLENNGDI